MRLLPLICALLAGVALVGCAGYRLGSTQTLPAGELSAQIVPFHNQTLEPRLADAVSAALRREIQRDATYRLATHGPGDLIISGSITEYFRSEQTLLPNDLSTGRDYRLTLTAHTVVRNRLSGQLLMDRTISGNTLIRVADDLTSSERQALPLLADDLARRIVASLADGDWGAQIE